MKQSKAEKFLEAFTDIDDRFIKEAMNYTMKKRFNFKPIIAVAACAVFALAAIPVVNNFVNATPEVQGTTGEVNFTVYESGMHDGEIIGTHKIEMELDPSREQRVNSNRIGTVGTVTLNGKTWTAEYKSDFKKSSYREAMYSYSGISNGEKVLFGINSVTGKCEMFMVTPDRENESTKILTRDELYEIAYNNFLLGGYTDDPENYTLSNEATNGKAGYWFKFSRFVDGIETSEFVMIGLRNNGDFYWFHGNRIGEMKNLDLSDMDMEKFYDTVEEKFKTIYGDAYVGFERTGAVYTKLTNGTYIFDYSPYIDVKNSDNATIKDRCILTITITK